MTTQNDKNLNNIINATIDELFKGNTHEEIIEEMETLLINSVKLGNRAFISDDDTDTEDEQEEHTQQEIRDHVNNMCLKNVHKKEKDRSTITIEDTHIYNTYKDLEYIKNNLSSVHCVMDFTYNFNIGDVVYKPNQNHIAYNNVYEVVRVTERRLYIKQLRTHIIIKCKKAGNETKLLIKYTKGDYTNKKVLHSNKSNHLNKWVFDSYMFYDTVY